MAKNVSNKVVIHKVEINVPEVLAWMDEQGYYVTSVQLRDQFNWPLREVARRLMRQLAQESKVIIADHPIRKRSYCYGLPTTPKPTAKTFAKPKPKAKEPSHFQQPDEHSMSQFSYNHYFTQ